MYIFLLEEVWQTNNFGLDTRNKVGIYAWDCLDEYMVNVMNGKKKTESCLQGKETTFLLLLVITQYVVVVFDLNFSNEAFKSPFLRGN